MATNRHAKLKKNIEYFNVIPSSMKILNAEFDFFEMTKILG